MRRMVSALAWLLMASAPAGAQTIQDGRIWWNVTVQERAGTGLPWRWYFEVQGRTRDGVDATDQVLVRPAIGYDVSSRSSVWIGYGYTPGFPAAGGVLHENRVWQQFLWNRPIGRAQFTSRSRLEERSIEGNNRLAWRFRQQVRVTRPLAGRLSAIAWDEVFLHLNSTSRTASGVDQNRIFGGLGVTINRTARVELGYMNQYVNSLRGPDRSHHILSGLLNLTF